MKNIRHLGNALMQKKIEVSVKLEIFQNPIRSISKFYACVFCKLV